MTGSESNGTTSQAGDPPSEAGGLSRNAPPREEPPRETLSGEAPPRETSPREVVTIGLTGGIGSGKTTVSAGLVARGAHLIDADAIVRELQEPGGEVLMAMVDRFGDAILGENGLLDRAAMAAIVFNESQGSAFDSEASGKGKVPRKDDSDNSEDSERASSGKALADLNAIVHPPVGREIARRLQAAYEQPEAMGAESSKSLVVLDIPLLAEGLLKGGPPRYAVSGVLVVDTPIEIAIERLIENRAMSREDAEARMANQVTRCQRLSVADHVLVNAGSLPELEPLLDAAYAWAIGLAATPPPEAPAEAD